VPLVQTPLSVTVCVPEAVGARRERRVRRRRARAVRGLGRRARGGASRARRRLPDARRGAQGPARRGGAGVGDARGPRVARVPPGDRARGVRRPVPRLGGGARGAAGCIHFADGRRRRRQLRRRLGMGTRQPPGGG
jgi:hypothetical protein